MPVSFDTNGYSDLHRSGTNVPERSMPNGAWQVSAVETATLVNSSNPTIVGAWDLQKPPQVETAKRVSLQGNLESLGPEGDRRFKVTQGGSNWRPEYKAICKLFMAYKSGGTEEFMGTGWLISNDIVVTAGHCLFESTYNGGCLSYIKCYFQYEGPNATGTYRWGVVAATAAEYLKAQAEVHDVGFIRLNAAVPGIDPIAYSATPAIAKGAHLGVVGFPGDLDYGNSMYAHWATVDYDLQKTNNLLRYEIDTTPGDSGAPVLRTLPNGKVDAVGVHVTGGFPNTGSCIGRVGNVFEEYILAMNVKAGYKTTTASIVQTAPGKLPAPGFQMISIKPTSTESVRYGHRPAPSLAGLGSMESIEALKESEAAVDYVLGRRPANKPLRHHSTAYGTLTRYPEVLVVRHTEDAPVTPDYDKAVADAKQQEDVQTIFFVDFPIEGLQGNALTQLQALQADIQSWQAWASTMCEGAVQTQIDKVDLPSDPKGQFARSTYRAKVFDTLFRKSTWFAKTFDQNQSKHISTTKASFHSEILTAALEGYSIPTSVFANLEKVLTEISKGISLGTSSGSEAQQYWIMLTKYNYLTVSQTVQTTIRVITFQVNQEARTYTSNKASYESVSFDLLFGQYQADFNDSIYSQIRKSIDDKLVSAGMDLVNSKSIDVPV